MNILLQGFLIIGLLEGFEIFNPSGIPEDLSLQAHHIEDTLDMLITHYGRHNVVEPASTKQELKTFNSVVASN